MSYFPINLWDIIINPSFTRPKQHIGIQVIIILQTIGITAQRITLLITVNAERTDTKLHPRLYGTDCLMKLFNQHIDITTTPIGLIRKTTAITGKARVIRKVHSLHGIRIEIIVHVDSIHIITGHDIGHDFTNIVPTFRKCRIEIQLIAIRNKPFRMLMINMFRRQLIFQRSLHPVRIDPGMKLHIPFPALFNHKLHRVPHRRRYLPLRPCQETAPRFMLRSIQRIRFGTHLENNGIDTCPLKRIQLINQRLFQLPGRNTFELPVDSLYPRSTKFTFGIFIAGWHLCPHSYHQKKSEK